MEVDGLEIEGEVVRTIVRSWSGVHCRGDFGNSGRSSSRAEREEEYNNIEYNHEPQKGKNICISNNKIIIIIIIIIII